MLEGHEIDYESLFDRSIKDFQPVQKLWPVGLRLALWILLETAILLLGVGVKGIKDLPGPIQDPGDVIGIGAFILTSNAAAFLALRSAIPGREVSQLELLLLMLAVFGAGIAVSVEPSAGQAFLHAVPPLLLQWLGLTGLPWVVLFWAVWRAVPLYPMKTGGLVGIASGCFALAEYHFICQPGGFPIPIIWQLLFGAAITVLSVLAGAVWLNPVPRWQQDHRSVEAHTGNWTSFRTRTAFPLAISCSILALVFALKGAREIFAQIPDFDLAINNYERSLAGFRPNVPSGSIETVLTAYVENGMPSYMWDFGREGFKLVGGRLERLSDGTPVTYTWFRGAKSGVMCMFRQTDGFNPPPVVHEEHHHLLFYEYRGFSVCLINVGGYGNFISVIVAAMPMEQFVPLVLTATL
jgi:hypothetical protein